MWYDVKCRPQGFLFGETSLIVEFKTTLFHRLKKTDEISRSFSCPRCTCWNQTYRDKWLVIVYCAMQNDRVVICFRRKIRLVLLTESSKVSGANHPCTETWVALDFSVKVNPWPLSLVHLEAIHRPNVNQISFEIFLEQECTAKIVQASSATVT